MSSDLPSATTTPDDLRKNFQRLQSDLNVVQTELDQALGVWRAILASEKQESRKVLEDQQRIWERAEGRWQKDREAYERKIGDLETFFNQQLSLTEKNAVRALNELDAAWQQERARWQQTLAQQLREARQREELQTAAQQQVEQRLAQALEDAQQEQPLRAQVAALEAEKAVWQQLFSQGLGNVTAADLPSDAPSPQLDSYINSLETHIADLEDFIRRIGHSTHPLRRLTDRALAAPTRAAR